jgi:hypothetical protein
MVVCGCGSSLNSFARPERFLTIGVNDVGRLFTPRYLVVINHRNQLGDERFSYIEGVGAEYVFTQLELGLARPNVVKFRLGEYAGTDFSDPEVLHYAQNSPYVALCLAAHMGARRIGLIGVDFTADHFFARTGEHNLAWQLPVIEEEYRRLGDALRGRGVKVFNLSAESRLTAFPKLSVEEFAGLTQPSDKGAGDMPLNVVTYSTRPLAGGPSVLARCIDARTPHAGRCVWAERGYRNGVEFAGGVEWTVSPEEAEETLARADLVVVHNGKVEARHRPLLAGKALITMAHNYMWNVDDGLVRQGFPGVVLGQYQATLPEFAGWAVVPNTIPIWEGAYQPGPKVSEVTICYTPFGWHERYPIEHPYYWHSKGYATTMRVLDRLATRYPIRLEVIREQHVPHSESLAMKRRAHVVIDECVTGSYHRNSLEGLAAGCVVVNGVGLLPSVVEVFRRCAGGGAVPFVRAGLDDLEGVLASLIEQGAAALARRGADNRAWVERHWRFTRQWQRFWLPVVTSALERARAGAATFS